MNAPIKKVIGTLCYLMYDNMSQVVLALKEPTVSAVARSLDGKRNTYGGGQELGDNSLAHTACRELREESGVIAVPEDLKKVAVITFHNLWGLYECHYFLADKFANEPRATSEMSDPKKYLIVDLPYDQMMDADSLILPRLFINKEKLIGDIYNDSYMKVTSYDFKKVDSFTC